MNNTRLSRFAFVGLAFAAVLLIASTAWAIYDKLQPSPDDWKLKYDVKVEAADAETLNVVLTLADGGRLKPIYSITVIAFSDPDPYGARTYKVKAPIKLHRTPDGKRVGQVRVPRYYANRAVIRFLTQTVDGRRIRTANAAYYDVPLTRFMK